MSSAKGEKTASPPKSETLAKRPLKVIQRTSCQVCGHPLPPKANFCANCGSPCSVRIVYVSDSLAADTEGPRILVDTPRGPVHPVDPWQFVLDQTVYVKMMNRAKKQGISVHDLMKDKMPRGNLRENPMTLSGSNPMLWFDRGVARKSRARMSTR